MRKLRPLLKEIAACRVCEAHLPLGPRPVLQAHTDARILIVGQAPGRKVHETGRPFDDPSGVRLRRWLGVDEARFYDPHSFAIVPMGFCYPGTGKGGDLPPRPECAETWRERVMAELKNVELTVVLGQYAQAWHLDGAKGSVTEVVQDWKRWWPKVIPLPHPSPRNQRWLRNNPWVEAEMIPKLQRRVKRVLRG